MILQLKLFCLVNLIIPFLFLPVSLWAEDTTPKVCKKWLLPLRQLSASKKAKKAWEQVIENWSSVNIRLPESREGFWIPAHHYYSKKVNLKSQKWRFLSELLKRTPLEQYRMNQRLTERHYQNEMSFFIKDPQTGLYTKAQAVPVSGMIAPLSRKHFKTLVQSTVPVMRALRDLLQQIYSHPDLKLEDLDLGAMPDKDKKFFFKVIRESLYFEPKLQAPQMKDYPFLSIGGFDAALGNPTQPEARFYEMNLGTPSGLSNNIQLLLGLSKEDPVLFQKIAPYLPRDNTFQLLRKTIESNALSWTGNPQGISVVISPGIYNGAHPDVVAIALFSGMPLVRPQDLYEDREGNIRMNTGALDQDPIVTGIYGRMEESFFFQSNEEGIPLRSPFYMDNEKLGKQWGIPLKNGIIYNFIYSPTGEKMGVHTDSSGQPLYQEVFDKIGKDPARPDAPRGSFAQAVLNRKLYYSALGGRLVDDKRLFFLISKYLAPKYQEIGQPIAHPIPNLEIEAYDQFYRSPDKYVVKEPDKSGGDGIYFVRLLTASEKESLIQKVRQSPESFVIQPIAEPTLVMSVGQAGKKELEYINLVSDLRLFVMMDAQGRVQAGPQSVLLRTAQLQGFSTNTSGGGGYGIAAILNSSYRSVRSPSFSLPIKKPAFVALPRLKGVRMFADRLNDLLDLTDRSQEFSFVQVQEVRKSLEAMIWAQRGVMDLLPLSYARYISVWRDTIEVLQKFSPTLKEQLQKLHAQVLTLRDSLLKEQKFLFPKVEEVLKKKLLEYYPKGLAQKNFQTKFTKQPVDHLLDYQPLEVPYVSHFRDENEVRFEQVEEGVYKASKDPVVQAILEEVQREGGEVRRVFWRKRENGELVSDWRQEAAPYFWVPKDIKHSAYGKPVIAINLSKNYALPALIHEYTHFKQWKRERNRLLKEEGLSLFEANFKAREITLQVGERVRGEAEALAAEMQAEQDYLNSPFNQGDVPPRPSHFWQPGFVNRLLYPEFEGVRDLLHRGKWFHEPFDGKVHLSRDHKKVIEKYFIHMISLALENQEKAIQYYKKLEQQYSVDDLKREAQLMITYFQNRTPLEMIIYPFGVERLLSGEIYKEFLEFYQKVFKKYFSSSQNE